jgi:hypothetical protein
MKGAVCFIGKYGRNQGIVEKRIHGLVSCIKWVKYVGNE